MFSMHAYLLFQFVLSYGIEVDLVYVWLHILALRSISVLSCV